MSSVGALLNEEAEIDQKEPSVKKKNENTSNKRVLPKRKAKSVVAGYAGDLYDLSSPPKKRSRSSVLQQTRLLPNFEYVTLNKLGLEDEDEEDFENASSQVLHSLRSSLPVPARTVPPGGSNRHAPETWRPKKFLTKMSSDEVLDVKVVGKKSSEKIPSENTGYLKKPVIKLKRVDKFGEAEPSDDKVDDTDPGSVSSDGDDDFKLLETSESADETDLNSETSSSPSRKSRKTRRRFRSSLRRRSEEPNKDKNSAKFEACIIKSNAFPMLKPLTQRVETLEAVYHRLHTSEIPVRLPCREAEFERICTFIKECIGRDAVSQAMYVSGVPGTGKTATVLQAVRYLKASKNYSKFVFVMVNAMELADPKQIFVEIYQQLFNSKKKIAPKTARKKLNEVFLYGDRKRLPVILLVDELDLLNTKKQEIVYDIFNWSANEESLVSVIAIANTLDLPERLLSQRVSSRLGANRLCFQPYDHEEIASIIRDRLCGSTAVESEAIELASRKVAAISGDLRKALDIVRSAAQLAMSAKQKQLTLKNVQEAIRQASTNVRVELIRALPHHSFLLLRAAVAEQMSSGLDEFLFQTIFKQYRLQCRFANVVPISTSAAYRYAMEMCSSRLLVAASGMGHLSRRFRLGMTTHDVQFAFKQVDESVF